MAAPALVRNGRLDILAAIDRVRAVLGDVHRPHPASEQRRFAFLDPRARDFYLDWERAANEVVAVLRSEAGRDPYDRGLSDVVGELSTPERGVPHPQAR